MIRKKEKSIELNKKPSDRIIYYPHHEYQGENTYCKKCNYLRPCFCDK